MSTIEIPPVEHVLEAMERMCDERLLTRGIYVGERRPRRHAARGICGGRRACAVGSLVIACGFEISDTYDVEEGIELTLEQVNAGGGRWPNGRTGFMARHPDVARIYELLNEAARNIAAARPELGIPADPDIRPEVGMMEYLFESAVLGEYVDDADYQGLIAELVRVVLREARRLHFEREAAAAEAPATPEPARVAA